MFCTLICCMDGRFIHLANEYIRKNYIYTYVDTITDAGPVSKIVNEKYLHDVEDKIVLISIYSKTEKENLSDEELSEIIKVYMKK